MDDLLKFKGVMSSFVFRAEEIKKAYQDALSDIPNIYNEGYISTQKQIEEEKYNDNMDRLKKDFIDRINVVKNGLLRAETTKDTSAIDYKLLERLNVIAQADIDLEKEEYLSLISDCVASGSSICTRKLQAIIKDKNLEAIVFPSASECLSLIDGVAGKIEKAITEYIPTQEGRNYNDYFKNKRVFDGDWIDSENEKFSRLTTSDIKSLTGKDLKTKLESKINVGRIDTSPSLAKQYAQDYSRKMMNGYDNPMSESAFIPAEADD